MRASHPFSLRLRALAALVAMSMALTACATTGAMAPRHLRIVNATFDDLTGLAFAPSGSGAFRAASLTQPLAGGSMSLLVDIPAGECRRDVRVTFRGGRALLYPDMDVCRHDGLRLMAGAGGAGKSTLLQGDVPVAAGSP